MMTKIILDKRLERIASLVSKRIVADIGTDHGKLVAKLFEEKHIDYAYLSDISSKSLDKAKSLLRELGYYDKAEFIVCDGLNAYENIKPCDAIIAGMGGEEIIKILSESKINDKVNSFILQPMKNVIKLREFLVNNNFRIVSDTVVKEGNQFYFIIKVVSGKDKLSLAEKYFGRSNLKEYSSDFTHYLSYEKTKYDDILSKVSNLEREKMEYFEVLCEVIKKGEGLC